MSTRIPSRTLVLVAALALTAGLSGCKTSGLSSLSNGSGSNSGSGYGSGASSSSSYQGSGKLLKVHDPLHVTYSLHFTSCTFGDGGQLPDPKCTPGAIDPSVTQSNLRSTICEKGGYTTKVRPSASDTNKAKFKVAYPAYGVAHSKKSELDHLVSLELGGSNDIANLWPEVGKLPNPKDKVENDLHAAVCAGDVSLIAAQQAIASNWQTAESRLGVRHGMGGSGSNGG
jgi:hypothetical protein